MITTDAESRLAGLEHEVAALHKSIEQNRITARIRRGLDHADQGQTLPAREALESLPGTMIYPVRITTQAFEELETSFA